MKSIFKSCFLLVSILALGCGSDDEETDMEKPTITIQYEQGFPQPCQVLHKGEQYVIKARVSDNLGLASYAIDIHNNFDHHTHDDQGEQCMLDPIKTPVTPLTYVENFSISGEVKEYEIEQVINIPTNVDIGDYHFQISVIDVTGWQSRTSIDVKIE